MELGMRKYAVEREQLKSTYLAVVAGAGLLERALGGSGAGPRDRTRRRRWCRTAGAGEAVAPAQDGGSGRGGCAGAGWRGTARPNRARDTGTGAAAWVVRTCHLCLGFEYMGLLRNPWAKKIYRLIKFRKLPTVITGKNQKPKKTVG